MNVILTGATGFLGSNILELFLHNGIRTFALMRDTSDTSRINHLLTNPLFHTCTLETIEEIFRMNQIDAVIHTATNYGRAGETLEEQAAINVDLPLRLLRLADTYGTKLFVNSDTFLEKAVPEDKRNYGYIITKKKFLAEAKARENAKARFINMKIYQMYGPNDNPTKFIPFLIKEFLSNKPRLALNPGLQERDYIYVADVAESYLAVLNHRDMLSPWEEFGIGFGLSCTLRDIVNIIIGETKSTTVPGFGDNPYAPYEVMHAIAHIEANTKIGWKAHTSLHDGLAKTIAFYKKQV